MPNCKSLYGKSREDVEFTGSKLADFTGTVRRPDSKMKWKYQHAEDKKFYMTSTGEYQTHLILGDGIYSRIRTERVFKAGFKVMEMNMGVAAPACT